MTSNPPLPVTGFYTRKDQAKWDRCTRMIGRGSTRSSTHRYAAALGALASGGVYTRDDVVFVSAEGNRGGRLTPDWAELQRAVDAGASFVTDVQAARETPYNLGEREVAAFVPDPLRVPGRRYRPLDAPLNTTHTNGPRVRGPCSFKERAMTAEPAQSVPMPTPALDRLKTDLRPSPAPGLTPAEREERAQTFDEAAREIYRLLGPQNPWTRPADHMMHVAAAHESCARAERSEARR